MGEETEAQRGALSAVSGGESSELQTPLECPSGRGKLVAQHSCEAAAYLSLSRGLLLCRVPSSPPLSWLGMP